MTKEGKRILELCLECEEIGRVMDRRNVALGNVVDGDSDWRQLQDDLLDLQIKIGLTVFGVRQVAQHWIILVFARKAGLIE